MPASWIEARAVPVVLLGAIVLATLPVVEDYNRRESRSVPASLPLEAPPLVVTTATAGSSAIAAYNRSGHRIYHNTSYTFYFDVDPVNQSGFDFLYVAHKERTPIACRSLSRCGMDVVELVDLQQKQTVRLWEREVAPQEQGNVHDVDLIGKDRLLVGDLTHDQVFLLNLASGEQVWTWRVSADYNQSTINAPRSPHDWAHLNDVNLVAGGHVMVSLDSFNRTVFVDKDAGVNHSMTLKKTFGQHNPDFLPAARGGPSVLVADSNSRRIAEYQRNGTTWSLVWAWQDARLNFPRDADRMKNDRTLIASGERMLELHRDEVVWSAHAPGGYDIEHLYGPDESSGTAFNNTVRSRSAATFADGYGPLARLIFTLLDRIPEGAEFFIFALFPDWMTYNAAVAATTQLLLAILLLIWYRKRVSRSSSGDGS